MTAKIFRNSMAGGALGVSAVRGPVHGECCISTSATSSPGSWRHEARLVARGVESMGMDYLDDLQSSNRITWVDGDGTVLYDSVADAATMENHADREEIREAMNGSQGTAQRASRPPCRKRPFYVARRLEDGTVIRLASAQYTVVVLLVSMVQPLLIILVLSLILAAVLANRLSKRIIRPILDLDLEHPEECNTYDELSPLLTRIRRQNDTIRGQMDQLPPAAAGICRPDREHVRGLCAAGSKGARSLL